MPNPSELKIDDQISFLNFPDEWNKAGFSIPKDSKEFMNILISRKFPSRVYQIDEYGHPWIQARIKESDGCYTWHTWAIMERSGWRKVKSREP